MPRSPTRPQGTRKQQGTTRKAQHKTPTRRAAKGEYLLLTGTSLISSYALECLAEALYGMMLVDSEGRYQQVIAIRIDVAARKLYGRCQEMYEAAPYMFAPCQKPRRRLPQGRRGAVSDQAQMTKALDVMLLEPLVRPPYAWFEAPERCRQVVL